MASNAATGLPFRALPNGAAFKFVAHFHTAVLESGPLGASVTLARWHARS